MLGSMIYLWAIVLLFNSAIASPVQIARRDISPDLFERLNLFIEYAALSGCDENNNATGGKISCEYGTCPLAEAADTVIIDAFRYNEESSPTGYLAVDHTNNLIILSFRGTISDHDTWADANAFTDLVEDDLCKECYVHRGFWDYWKSIESRLLPEIDDLVTEYPEYTLTVTGHSLGGAVATLGGTALRNKGYTLDLYTFGSPKVGNFKLATFITEQSTNTYRVTHAEDGVPKVPYYVPSFIFHTDYSQPSPEYFINQTTGVSVAISDIQVVEGINSPDGVEGTVTDPNFGAHGWYFKDLAGFCARPVDASPENDNSGEV